ncbi:sensor histidine kinase [Actinocatenispora rupis]|uniref:histidine kinase n=1 Tax=Actinocatenispora rupis TaxID=519421 RepID=A0A8J3NC05_9ACTN|nr:sensor histidine kinase [Actinocatenispora rupis]GID13596.1 histidine kinase [Actinocatenispora rupis]
MTTAVPAADRHPRQRSLLNQLGVDTGYCLLGLPLSIASFVVVLAMFCVGVGTAVTMGGIFVLIGGMFVARAFANLERRQINRVLRRPITVPRYKDRTKRTGLRRVLIPLTEGQSWADLLWGVFTLVPAVVAFSVTVTWWAVGLGYTLNFAWEWAVLPYEQGLSDLMGLQHTYGNVVAVNTAVGLLFLVSAPFVVRGMALMRAGFARMLLTRERVTALQERVEELTESREAARSAEASALRRLERDIHDGPQQRLVRLTMDLSLAQRRMRTDPEAAAPLLAEAIEQTRETLDELRALSRGIAPPILADRGLAAALAAVTGRCTVQTELEVDLPSPDRLPTTVENTAYFLVAEALTNVAKHSRATWCRVRVTGDGSVVYVTISDNGVGGAHSAKGHGLAGLADRVRAADGRFDLDSPEGGPTVLTAELPCGS